MLKLEIKMDEKKIEDEQKYTIESIYQTISEAFEKCNLCEKIENDGTRVYYGTGNRSDYGYFGLLITTFCEKAWFMDYVTRWIWYNSDDGRDEEDFSVEDVLYFYTKKESVA